MITKIPNILTIGRIIIVPIFVLSFFIPGFFGDLIPFFLFVLASFTDYLDGLLARLFKGESKLGELLVSEICPVGREISRLMGDKVHLVEILKKGSEKACIIAEENLKNVRDKVGLI